MPCCLFYSPLAFQRDPTVDTFEARADCRANELTLTRGREHTVQDRPCSLLHGPIGRFLYRPPTEHCYDKPIKNLPMGPWSKVYGHPSPPKIQTFQIIQNQLKRFNCSFQEGPNISEMMKLKCTQTGVLRSSGKLN